MDGDRFDAITRVVSVGQARRGLLKTLAGGALGAAFAAIGLHDARAAGRPTGAVCSKNADCAGGLCSPKDRTGRRTCAPNLCIDRQVFCKPLDQCHVSGACDPSTGECSNPVAGDGTSCDSGGGAGSGTCQSGTCVVAPIACTPIPDYFGTCPGGQYCDGDHCVCHVGSCSSGSDCGYFDGCLGGCCCAENGNTNVGCAPGHNNDCCSGFCNQNGLCAALPE